jgi:hypothetical protein
MAIAIANAVAVSKAPWPKEAGGRAVVRDVDCIFMTILVLNGKKTAGTLGRFRLPAWRDKVGRIPEALAQDYGRAMGRRLEQRQLSDGIFTLPREKTRPSRKLMAIKVARDRHVIIRDPDEHAMRGRCHLWPPCKAQDTQ